MINRRDSLGALAALGLLGRSALAAPSSAGRFDWAWLRAEAARLARGRARALPGADPGAYAVDYDAANRIAYRADKTIGPDDGFGVRLFPLTRFAASPVRVFAVDRGIATPVERGSHLFQVVPGQGPEPRILDQVSGFRVINRGGVGDWLAFQGASYFRSAGALDQYGLSARGIAIDTGIDGREEFPRFTSFWLAREAADSLTIYALLEGPSVTGAFRFVNRKPGGVPTQDISCELHFRRDVERLGIAPLTSMFWFDEGNRGQAIDWRPEIHDSDCLLIHNGAGERICRPLGNPPRPTINSFADGAPKGFGLMQRDRAFDHYQDDGVFYEKRPSLWVEPQGDWGRGAVNLYEIPTTRETEDNIVAFWTPAAPVKAGASLRFDYRLRWIGGEPDAAPLARVVDRWTGVAGRPGSDPIPDARRLVVDFEGPSLAGLDRGSGVTAAVSIDKGRILSADAYPVVGMGQRWRLVVDATQVKDAANIRATLERSGRPVTETVIHPYFA
jgi:glucans biosynthesis protein